MILPKVFNAYQAARYAGISDRQLRYWDEVGLVRPSVQATGGVAGRPRKYSRDDVLKLKAVAEATRSRSLQAIRSEGFERELAEATASETWRREGFVPSLLYRVPEESGQPESWPGPWAERIATAVEAREQGGVLRQNAAAAPRKPAEAISPSPASRRAQVPLAPPERLTEGERWGYRSGSWMGKPPRSAR